MKIVAPHFFDVPVKERRLIFVRRPESQSTLVLNNNETSSGNADGMDPRITKLAHDALVKHLKENPNIAELFASSEKKGTEDTLYKRAFNEISRCLLELFNADRESGAKTSLRLLQLYIRQLTDKICEIIQVRHKLKLDFLTGVYNRQAFEEQKDIEIANSGRKNPLCMLIVDLDQFKGVNDTFGHQSGDEVMKEFSECLLDAVRDTDHVSRYGGDEFAILLKNTKTNEAVFIANRVRKILAEKKFKVGINGNATEIQLTASIGVSHYLGKRRDPKGKKMIDQTDHHLYIMKGRRKDKHGVKKERRGRIACSGLVLTESELDKITEENPHMVRLSDLALIDRRRITADLMTSMA